MKLTDTQSSRSLGIVSALLGSSLAIATAVMPAIPSVAGPIAQADSELPNGRRVVPAPSVIQAIRQDLQRQFQVRSITVISASKQTWPDGCLGLPRGKEGCTLAVVPGWRITVSDGQQDWTYRTDDRGQVLRLETPTRGVLPKTIAQKLVRQVARDIRVPATSIKIAQVKPHTFGGCMDIYTGPNQACTAIAISGWKAIVTSPRNNWVYHLSQDGTQIVQNTTASGATLDLEVSFLDETTNLPVAQQVVFQSLVSGDLTGSMTRIELTEDGKVTVYRSSPTARFRPIVRKTLSRKEVAAFKKLLEEQRFPNFHGLRYLTSAALADYPTTRYQSQYVATEFIDLEKQNLPRSLQRVINRWDAIIQP